MRMILKKNVCLNIQQTFSVCDEAYELTGVMQGKHFVRALLGSIIIGFIHVQIKELGQH